MTLPIKKVKAPITLMGKNLIIRLPYDTKPKTKNLLQKMLNHADNTPFEKQLERTPGKVFECKRGPFYLVRRNKPKSEITYFSHNILVSKYDKRALLKEETGYISSCDLTSEKIYGSDFQDEEFIELSPEELIEGDKALEELMASWEQDRFSFIERITQED